MKSSTITKDQNMMHLGSEKNAAISTYRHGQDILSVSEVSAILKDKIESDFSLLRIRGEISGLKSATSGHIYFNLKDNRSLLNMVCWKGTKLLLKLEDGLEVICDGSMTTYSGRSVYQFVVRTVEVSGVGALLALLEKRKQKFIAAGLFDKEKKLPIPFLPRTIGIITSIQGAVIKDILHRISARFPLHVTIWDVSVQGQDAARQIAEAIRGFNNLFGHIVKPDLLIMARGGGSLEDLWCFNEEEVIYAIAESKIPIISAVGHETDITLSDLAADMRAPTPTAAAEFAVPVLGELFVKIKNQENSIKLNLIHIIKVGKNQLIELNVRFAKIAQNIVNKFISLQEKRIRLYHVIKRLFEVKTYKLNLLVSRSPIQRMQNNFNIKKQLLDSAVKAAAIMMSNYYKSHKQKLLYLDRLLYSFSYKNVLQRGFIVARDIEGENIISKIDFVKRGQKIVLEFYDGRRIAEIIE